MKKININSFNNLDRFSKIIPAKNRIFYFKEVICKHCNSEKVKVIEGKYIGVCGLCRKRTLFINLQRWQEVIIKSKHNVKLNCGAVGTGKTFLSCVLIYLHIMSVSFAVGNIYGKTLQQLKGVFQKELEKFFLPSDFIIRNKEQWKIKNGSVINWNSSSDSEKTKGYNLTFAVITESNTLKDDKLYLELMKRLRHQNAFEYLVDKNGERIMRKYRNTYKPVIKYNKTLLILESNNEMSYMTDLIEKADTIYYTPHADILSYDFSTPKGGTSIGACLTAIDDDMAQPEEYKKDLIAKTPERDKSVVLRAGKAKHSNFLYPDFEKAIIPSKTIPTCNYDVNERVANKIFFVTDLGGIKPQNAKTTMLVCIIDVMDNIIYIVDEYYNTGSPLEHSNKMREIIQHWESGYEFCGHGCDSSADTVAVGFDISAIDNYRRMGINMIPIKKIRKSDMVGNVNYLFKKGKLKILNNCKYLKEELYESYYRYNFQIKKDIIKVKNDDLTDTLNYIVRWTGIDSTRWKYFNHNKLSNVGIWISSGGKLRKIS